MQLLALVVGHNSAGKTTLSKTIMSRTGINRVSGDSIREVLAADIPFYHELDYSYPDARTNSANKIVTAYRMNLIEELLSQGQSVLVDGGGITCEGRRRYLGLAGSATTMIIEAALSEEELLRRLERRDLSSHNHRWVEFYERIRKGRYEPVTPDEADTIIRFDQQNVTEIAEYVSRILSMRER